MAEQWFTYADLAERLGVSPEAARQKAIRARWPRRTANDGRAQVRVELADLLATLQTRKPKEDPPADDQPTPGEPPVDQASDAIVLAAVEAHLATLREMLAKMEAAMELERQRTDVERVRADGERARADAERARADDLARRIEEMREADGAKRAGVEHDLEELRRMIADLRRPWWRRMVG